MADDLFRPHYLLTLVRGVGRDCTTISVDGGDLNGLRMLAKDLSRIGVVREMETFPQYASIEICEHVYRDPIGRGQREYVGVQTRFTYSNGLEAVA